MMEKSNAIKVKPYFRETSHGRLVAVHGYEAVKKPTGSKLRRLRQPGQVVSRRTAGQVSYVHQPGRAGALSRQKVQGMIHQSQKSLSADAQVLYRGLCLAEDALIRGNIGEATVHAERAEAKFRPVVRGPEFEGKRELCKSFQDLLVAIGRAPKLVVYC